MMWGLTLNTGDPLRELLDPEQIFEHILAGLVRLPLALVVRSCYHIIHINRSIIDFTLVAARLGFFGGDLTAGPDSASDHSSVEIEIVGFLIRSFLKRMDHKCQR